MAGGTGMRRVLACAGTVVALSLGGAGAAQAQTGLEWAACGEAADVECATATLPRDYDRPGGATVDIAVARVPAAAAASRIGVLFFNFGGPGAPAAEFLEAFGRDLFPAYADRFDIVAVDPRGVGQSSPSIDCEANQETEGIYAQPFTTPFNLDREAFTEKVRDYIAKCERNGDILRHVSTANVARDMDAIRALLGEERITYFGYSYGTLLGATYARLFPGRYRAVVLDGPVDAEGYLNRPMSNLAEQTAGFERALGRFFQACARDQAACSGFGGEDPWSAYDELVEAADRAPIPAPRYTPDPRPVDGDDILEATISALYSKQRWGVLALALAQAAGGDGSRVRAVVDDFYDRRPDGTYGPGTDRYFTIGAAEQRYPRGVDRYLRRGDESWGSFDHFWVNHGYVELNYGLWRRRDQDAYRGPVPPPRRRRSRARRGHHVRPRDPVPGRPAAPARPPQRPPAHHARRRPHRLRGQLRLHRRGGRRLRPRARRAGRGHGLPPAGALRRARRGGPRDGPEVAGRGAAVDPRPRPPLTAAGAPRPGSPGGGAPVSRLLYGRCAAAGSVILPPARSRAPEVVVPR